MSWKLFKNVSSDQIIEYLDKDYKNSILLEMGALLKAGIGEFTIPLMFFSYVLELSEYLHGQRPFGKDGEDVELGFIRNYFDTSIYKDQEVKWFYYMYRHGLCHRFHPQNLLIDLESKKAILKWLVFSDEDGERNSYSHNFQIADNDGKIIFEKRLDVKHFQIVQVHSAGEITHLNNYAGYWLPISINALKVDLVIALDKYISAIRNNIILQNKFRDKIKNIHYSAKIYPTPKKPPYYECY
ncbi:hypothetical protein K8S19_08120 [bacterium]|nr:hypothetical protein [bacterium]